MSKPTGKHYHAWLLEVEHSAEAHLGYFRTLSKALLKAKVSCRERGVANWDWIVEKWDNGEVVNVRSSIYGFERARK